MAKTEEKDKKNNSILSGQFDEENIQDIIKQSSVVTDEIATAAAEEIAKKRKEKLTEELKKVVQKCEYTVSSGVLSVRRSNRVNKRKKQYLKDISALAEDIKSGKKPVSAWDKEATELKKQFDKDLTEIGKDIDQSQKDLDNLFPESWTWRYSEFVPR